MFGTTRSSDGLDDRRKRILYRAWHRGTREMDLFLGRFADVALEAMTDEELDVFETLMNAADQDLTTWVTGKNPIPPTYDTPLFHRILDFAKANPVTD
ncbi:succinate dehydrogenase assembly factor 2 [Coralliovum pocilloporae]|uniref:FAD assembly factor SdhE n=1 Tax=Coralliovum pocilloporae TaxID=3066369 RepID=UPI0033078BD8